MMFRIASLCLLAAACAQAQPVPRLNAVNPDYVERGTTVEITLTGEQLQAATAFRFSGEPGLTATLAGPRGPSAIETSGTGISTATEAPDPKRLVIRVAIAPDAPLGPRELRVITPGGISNPQVLQVSPFPERREREPNNSVSQAQRLMLPAAVSGRISGEAEADFFQFTARKGEHLVFEVFASRIGSPLDASLAVLSQEGKELARNENAVGLDPRIAFTAPEAGDYVLQIRDYRFQGSGNHRYRLVGGALPWVTSVFPMGGQRGQAVEVELAGVNLGAQARMKLQLDAQAGPGRQEIRVKTDQGLSNPFLFEVGLAPETLETEPNDTPGQATQAVVPGAWNGRIDKPGDVDVFKFKADRNQRVVFEVAASRFGSPLDALLTLTDANGSPLVINDDGAQADARIEADLAENQEYQVQIRDLLERGGKEFQYRIQAFNPQPDFSLKFYPDDPRIHRGSHAVVRCELIRINGFADPVRVTLDPLPPGVVCDTLVLTPATLSSGYLTLTASRDAALGTHPIRLTATSGARVRHGQPLDPPQPNAPERASREAFLTVLEPAPFTFDVLTEQLSLEQEQSGALEVAVHRQAGFDGEIRFTVEGFAAGREPITRNFEVPAVTAKPGEFLVKIPMKAVFNSEAGTRPILVRADSGALAPQHSRKIPATLVQLPFMIAMAPSKDTQVPFDGVRQNTQTRLSVAALPPGTASAAGESTFAVLLERRGPFAGEVSLAVEGLPEGITVDVPKIRPEESVAVIKLTADEQAPGGKEFPFTVVGSAMHQDRVYRQRTRPGTLVITAPERTEIPQETPATAGR